MSPKKYYAGKVPFCCCEMNENFIFKLITTFKQATLS